jgi:hypothetical protein
MNSIAAAKKRRAGIQPPIQPSMPPPQQTRTNSFSPAPAASAGGLTLPQVISLVDQRLTTLETFVKQIPSSQETASEGNDSSTAEYIVEMDRKFDMLVEEITNIKEVLLKLQTYTLEVNHSLLSSLPNINITPPPPSTFLSS